MLTLDRACTLPVKRVYDSYYLNGISANIRITLLMCGYQMLMYVNTNICWAIACQYGNILTLRYQRSVFP